jgi:hypothetical protein
MEINRDTVTFSTGKTMYANRGIIGLASDLRVTEGYDGGFPAWPDGWRDDCLTKEERQELADYMIALWQKFRDADAPPPEEF